MDGGVTIRSVKPDGARIRPAEPSDAAAIVDTISAAFSLYAEFAPSGWRPPEHGAEEVMAIGQILARPGVWYRIAEDSDGLAGQCGVVPAYTERWLQGDPIPGLAHFWQLFVRPDWWGRGLAPYLHDAAIEAMRADGFERARLRTPAGQARARRFYERGGWELAESGLDGGALGLEVVEYRREL
jgi:GNAT superfamily N-acetyltransferase